MAGDRNDQGQSPEPPWHHSTPVVAGASLAALFVIGLVVWAAVALTSANGPEDAPIDFIPPTFAPSSTKTSKSTTTPTITTTRTPVTTDFGLPDVSDTSGTSSTETSETSETSETTETTTTTTSTSPTSTVPPSTRSNGGYGGEYPTTYTRPRTNVTRTLYPAPGG